MAALAVMSRASTWANANVRRPRRDSSRRASISRPKPVNDLEMKRSAPAISSSRILLAEANIALRHCHGAEEVFQFLAARLKLARKALNVQKRRAQVVGDDVDECLDLLILETQQFELLFQAGGEAAQFGLHSFQFGQIGGHGADAGQAVDAHGAAPTGREVLRRRGAGSRPVCRPLRAAPSSASPQVRPRLGRYELEEGTAHDGFERGVQHVGKTNVAVEQRPARVQDRRALVHRLDQGAMA